MVRRGGPVLEHGLQRAIYDPHRLSALWQKEPVRCGPRSWAGAAGLCPGGGFQHPCAAFSFGPAGKPFRVGHSVLRLPGGLLRLVCGDVHWPGLAVPFPEPAAGSPAGPGALPADAGAAVLDGSSGGHAHGPGPSLLGQCLSPALLCAGGCHPPLPAENTNLGRADRGLGHCRDSGDLHGAVHRRQFRRRPHLAVRGPVGSWHGGVPVPGIVPPPARKGTFQNSGLRGRGLLRGLSSFQSAGCLVLSGVPLA